MKKSSGGRFAGRLPESGQAAGWGAAILLLALLAGCSEPREDAAVASAGRDATTSLASRASGVPRVPGKVPLMVPDAPFEFDAETRARQHLTRVALGKAPADLVISGATVLNVFTLSWMEDHDIVIAGERIAWVGPRGEWKGERAETVDASGRYAVPGFGEAHKHIESSHLTPEFEAEMVLPQGTTWIAEGSHEFANVNSEHNAEFWLKAADAGSPLKIYPALGSATPPTAYESGGGYYGYAEVRRIIESDRRVIGLDEVMDWPAVWNSESPGYQRLWETMQATRDARAVIEGHGSGLRELPEINAMAAAGLSSDHETATAKEAWDKMQRGIFLQLRPATIVAAIPYFVEQGLKDWSNISVTTDDRDASASLSQGTMDYNIKVALRAGAPLEAAYAMGSYYPARHWHIEDQVGSIAPGRYADVVLLTDPATVSIDRVYSSGQLVGAGGQYVGPHIRVEYPAWATNTINVGRELLAEDFAIRVHGDLNGDTNGDVNEATVALLQPFYFEDAFMTTTMPVANGLVQRDPAADITKVGLVDRYHGTGAVSRMFWRNVGPKTPNSAAGCSVAHDLHNIWVVGSSDEAMAMVVNEVAAMQGGCVLVHDHEVVAKVRYEIGGLMSQRPAREVADEIDRLYAAADAMEWFGEDQGWPRRMIFAFLTCSPWQWVMVAPYEGNAAGFVNVVTGATHPVAW